MTSTNGSGDTARDLERISFAFHDQGLVGTGMGPVGTSLSEGGNGYRRLATWRDRLDGAVAPELPHEHTAPSYWYRRFDDGQGALLRRLPEPAPSDRRGSRAQALVGAALNAPRAIVIALGTWSEVHTWLSAPRDTDQGWACVPSYSPHADLHLPEGAYQELEREAAAREGLVPLVARLLRDPASPVDIPVRQSAPDLDERGRLLLLWGAYRTLLDVLGTEREPRGSSSDWSFSTYEPWPERGTTARPRIAFRPPGPGSAGAFALDVLDTESGESGSPYTAIARWLVGHLGAGTLAEATDSLPKDRRAGHAQLLEHLDLARRRQERRRTSRTAPAPEDDRHRRLPTRNDPQEQKHEPRERRNDPREQQEQREQRNDPRERRNEPRERRSPAPRAPDDQGGRGGRGHRVREEPARPGRASGQRAGEGPHRPPDRPSPDGQRSPGDAPAWRQHDHPAGTDHERLFAEALIKNPPPPGAPPPTTPTRPAPADIQLQALLERLRWAEDPSEISEVATQLVEHYHPGFRLHRRLVARGSTSSTRDLPPVVTIALAVLVVLLAVCLLFALV